MRPDATPARELIREGARRLAPGGPAEQARREAEWLLGRLVGVRPLELYARDTEIPEGAAGRFLSQIEARAAGTPLQYLLGEAEFFGERFAVRPGVFIPRPETEAIVEAFLRLLRVRERELGRPLRLLDLGTGTGCIAITLARALPACLVVGVELSWDVLCVARQNVTRHGVASRVRLLQGRWEEAIGGGFDGVVANPPYVPSARVDELPLDVRQEPRLSLDGGADGMRALDHLLRRMPRHLQEGGLVALECGEDQVDTLLRRAQALPWVEAASPVQDLASRPRGLLITHR